jgi:hypothetical protein
MKMLNPADRMKWSPVITGLNQSTMSNPTYIPQFLW